MWQHHYVIAQMRISELAEEAERRRRWRREDEENGRAPATASPGPARAAAGRAIAWLARAAMRVARRVGGGAVVDAATDWRPRDSWGLADNLGIPSHRA